METLTEPVAGKGRRVRNRAYLENATVALRRGNYHRTLHTDHVIGVLADAEEPLGAYDIKAILQRATGATIHITNVYRILDRLVDTGAALVVSSLSPSGKGTAYIRREDCAEDRPGIPVVVVDMVLRKATVMVPHPELLAEMRRFISAHDLPESDYSLQIVAGNKHVERGAN